MALRAAIVTGVAGQDGSYLAELLLEKGYTVYGFARYTSETKMERLSNDVTGHPNFHIVRGDMTDSLRITTLIQELAAVTHWDQIEVYNLAAQSHVKVSFEQPEWTSNVNSLGALRWLEAIHQTSDVRFRFYQAGTSEMFGKVQETPQTEKTPFWPRSPYGVSKVFAYWITKNYREAYGMYACTGILFNHESERRGEEFVTRKITKAIGDHKFPIRLGNLDAKRDWGHARDYIEAMWHMLQLPIASDYVVSTGETHSVREFVELAFKHTGVVIEWRGDCEAEVGINALTGDTMVMIDPAFYRPAEVDALIGDSSAFRALSGWTPKIDFPALVERMVRRDDVHA
jgi:GDPmannose 4,6-dehydratase